MNSYIQNLEDQISGQQMDDTNNQKKIDLLIKALESISMIKLDKCGYQSTLQQAVKIARTALSSVSAGRD